MSQASSECGHVYLEDRYDKCPICIALEADRKDDAAASLDLTAGWGDEDPGSNTFALILGALNRQNATLKSIKNILVIGSAAIGAWLLMSAVAMLSS